MRKSDWSWRREIQELFNLTDSLLNDRLISSLLKKLPPESKKQVIQDSLTQLHISDKFDAMIIAGESHLRMCERISTILNNRSGQFLVPPQTTLAGGAKDKGVGP